MSSILSTPTNHHPTYTDNIDNSTTIGKRTAAGTRAGKAGFGAGHMYGDYYPNAPVPGSSSSVASQDTLETLDDGQQTRKRQQQQAFARPNTTRTANSVASPGGHSQYSIASPYSTHSAMYALSPSEPSRSMLNGITSEEYNRREAEAFLTVLRRQVHPFYPSNPIDNNDISID